MIKEACVETFEEAQEAEKRGANRIELCSHLANDGLTPSFELMKKTCANLNIPVMVMIRPRAGNFVYDVNEISQMKEAIDQAKKAGACGVVFGLLTSSKKIDEKNTRMLAEYAYPLPVTFHKAIDELEKPEEGVKTLKKVKGIQRILTSGGKATAREGLPILRKMLQISEGSPVIMAAGKVTHENITEISQLLGSDEFHGRRIVGDLTSP